MSFREGQGQQKNRRFLERSNEVMEFSINTARSKGQGQQKPPPVSGTFERRGSNRFKPVQHLLLCDMPGEIDHNVTCMETLTAM